MLFNQTPTLALILSAVVATSQLISAQPETHHNNSAPEAQQAKEANQTNASGQILQPNNATMVQIPKLVDGIKTIIDLSWPLNNDTLHWPKNTGFQYISVKDGEAKNDQNQAYYVRSDAFTMAVHTGTHLDAPRHFSQSGWTVDQIPLDRLIDVPAHVIDLSAKVNVNRTYNFQKSDFIDAQTNKPLVSPKSVVLIYTGISKFYEQGKKAYFGTETTNISEMSIPGFSKEAAEYMVEMKVYGVGLDAASADSSDRHGANETYDPVAHTIFNSNNIYILENVGKRLSEIVGQDAQIRLSIAPLAITGGSGSPVRLVAFTLHDDRLCGPPTNSATGFFLSPRLTFIMTTIGVVAGTFIFGRRIIS